ncbi:MAG: sulfotransferase family protein [Halocynthiibacter sp.]
MGCCLTTTSSTRYAANLQTAQTPDSVITPLPQARIVVVRRDPRDNLFSIYKNMFGEGRHLYSYDLNDLAEVYKTFDDLIAFWRKISPGRIYEIHYEDLVRNPELETRKLLEAIDLPLEDACLAPEKNPRQVDTLSVYQVRQPVYHSSIGAWKHYEKDLNLWLRKLDL